MHLGIDLGTSSVRVYAGRRGLVIQEPSVVAIDCNSGKILAVGARAEEMLGKTPAHIAAVRPLRDGVIADYAATEKVLRDCLRRVRRGRPLRPTVSLCVPAALSGVESRAMREAALAAGAARAWLVEAPLAAAVGAGLDLDAPEGKMVVDIGGGVTDVAVIAMGEMVVRETLRVAGCHMDEAVMRLLRRRYHLMVGEKSAELLKIRLGSADVEGPEQRSEVSGRDVVNGLPRTVVAHSREIREALAESLGAIREAVRQVLERTPPELCGDLLEVGMVLTGGGALLSGMAEFLAQATGLPVHRAEDPLACAAVGAGRMDPRRLTAHR